MTGADTIFALATTRGKAGIAVIRLSGPRAWGAVGTLCGELPEPRQAGLRRLRNAAGETLDEALVLVFEAGASFTGEPVAELHLHGSLATIDAVQAELSAEAGLRIAEPGEFTRRALENDRLDLAQVEGLADLIDAETEAQRRQAFRVFSGELGRKANSWRARLLRAAALLEATIDFADEDVPQDVTPEVNELLQAVAAELEREAAGAAVTERLREGFEVAILGAPNVGKSTLLNTLAGREAAITSATAGTTRDVIEVRMDLNGLPVTLLDTAGLREAQDEVERIGVARALDRARGADLRVFLVESDGADWFDLSPGPEDIVVQAKSDLRTTEGFAVSGLTGAGLAELVARIAGVLDRRMASAATITRARHRGAVQRAVAALHRAQIELGCSDGVGPQVDLAAEELRHAIRALDSLVGRVDVEEVLGEIFASFCIGK